MSFIDSRSTSERLSQDFCESLDDVATAVIESNDLTIDEAVDLLVKEVEDWLEYYGKRAEFYRSFKDALRQRLS
jgi:predicted DNA-binding protein